MNKLLLAISTIILITTLNGCATAASYNIEKFWQKDGITLEQAKKVFFDCTEMAKSTAERETQVGGLTESCMSLKGYKWGVYKTMIH